MTDWSLEIQKQSFWRIRSCKWIGRKFPDDWSLHLWKSSSYRRFSGNPSLCSFVEHLTLLTSVAGQIELVNTETGQRMWTRGCLGVSSMYSKWIHGGIFEESDATLAQWPHSNLSELPTFLKNMCPSLEFVAWNPRSLDCRPVALPHHRGPTSTWLEGFVMSRRPKKTWNSSPTLVLSETVSVSNTRDLSVWSNDVIRRPQKRLLYSNSRGQAQKKGWEMMETLLGAVCSVFLVALIVYF